MVGFEPVFVNSIDQAINLIEISRSFCSGFDLLIVTISDILKLAVKYLVKLKELSKKIKIIVVDRVDDKSHNKNIKDYFETENVQFCDIDNMVGYIKNIFGQT
jgi:CO dehydrogenase nickel-insertion accessory protein CooC1